jgi:hypothetical protein
VNPTGEPLDEHVLDELLSADLDGELAAAAADLGLTVDEARAAISRPRAVARRSDLARAGELVGAPVPLDPDAAARLVTASITRGRQETDLDAARRRRESRSETARRALVVAGSAAALIAVIVGLANMSPSSDDSASTSYSAPIESADSGNGTATTGARAFGDVSDTDQLRRRVEAQLRTLSVPKRAASGTTSLLGEASKGVAPPTGGYASDQRAAAQQYRIAACAPAARTEAGGSAPVLTGRAVSGGRPVTVYVFERRTSYDVVVLGRDCSVVTRLSLP